MLNLSPCGMMPVSPDVVQFAPYVPPTFDQRDTEDNQVRLTEDDQIRIVE